MGIWIVYIRINRDQPVYMYLFGEGHFHEMAIYMPPLTRILDPRLVYPTDEHGIEPGAELVKQTDMTQTGVSSHTVGTKTIVWASSRFSKESCWKVLTLLGFKWWFVPVDWQKGDSAHTAVVGIWVVAHSSGGNHWLVCCFFVCVCVCVCVLLCFCACVYVPVERVCVFPWVIVCVCVFGRQTLLAL